MGKSGEPLQLGQIVLYGGFRLMSPCRAAYFPRPERGWIKTFALPIGWPVAGPVT